MMPRLKTWLDQMQPENQLSLFNEEDESEVVIQTSMMEEYEEFYEGEEEDINSENKSNNTESQNKLLL